MRLAFDLGTTTLAGRLLAPGGETVAEAHLPNPQASLGADVIRRLEAALAGRDEELQKLLAGGMNALAGELLSLAALPKSAITAAAAAANPAVTFLLRRLPPREILFPPHRPRESRGVLLNPAPLGLDLPVPLYLFPLVSGYVGGDLVAFLYGEDDSPSCRLYLDIGTNGEMALRTDKGWWTTSVAAGPAFEGGGISCGMRAVLGAVEDVAVEEDRLRLRTIGAGAPRGICGSGLAAAVAAAREGGLLDRRGTLAEPEVVATNLARHLVETPAGRALRLYRDASVDLLLTQDDIRSFQLAKGAVRGGVECLLRRAGNPEVEEVVVTGAFGLSLSPAVLKGVAMLPANMIDRVRFVPGGALAGVSRLLLDPEGPARAEALSGLLRPTPLSGTPAFEKAFLAGLDF